MTGNRRLELETNVGQASLSPLVTIVLVSVPLMVYSNHFSWYIAIRKENKMKNRPMKIATLSFEVICSQEFEGHHRR